MSISPQPSDRHEGVAATRRGSTAVWTLDEILAAPETGDWFYGIVSYEHRYCLAEIFLGLGFCPAKVPYPWWHPRSWWWLLQDVRRTSRRKVTA